jgi:hypothetical protein
MDRTYCVVRRSRRDGSQFIARNIDTLAEAGELALRLLRLQEQELGGTDEFIAEAE